MNDDSKSELARSADASGGSAAEPQLAVPQGDASNNETLGTSKGKLTSISEKLSGPAAQRFDMSGVYPTVPEHQPPDVQEDPALAEINELADAEAKWKSSQPLPLFAKVILWVVGILTLGWLGMMLLFAIAMSSYGSNK